LQESPSRAEPSSLASVSERPREVGLGLEREHGSGALPEAIIRIPHDKPLNRASDTLQLVRVGSHLELGL